MRELLLVRYGEIFLKGLNRPYFIRALVRKIRYAVRDLGAQVWVHDGRIFVNGFEDLDECVRRVTRVFGVHSVCPAVEMERDDFDASLAHAFANAGKPIFGICLGIQTLNKAFGGTLEEMFKKRTQVEHLFREHLCLTTEGSVTRSLFGDTFPINSRHQICVDRVADGFIVTALSPDGIVEEMRHETLPIYGFQYHPERMRGEYPEPPDGPDMTRLFAWFVEQCKKGRKRNETD